VWHWGTSGTSVEHFFTASQAWTQQLSSQEPFDNTITILSKENTPNLLELPETLSRSPMPPRDPQADISNLELHTALLALAHQTAPCLQKRHRGIREPNTLSRGSADDLYVFIFQYQIYFYICKREFREDSEKIYFTISYPRGITLNYFELFINKPDPY